jgi:hypothetical protein
MNPRTILGKTWWDRTRRTAYKANHYNCWACSISPDDDPYNDKLEAHECYDIDWQACKATYLETVALCYRCHNFIHAGRMRSLVESGDEPADKLLAVLKRGVAILRAIDKYPYWRTYVLYLEYVERALPSVAIGRARDLRIVEPASTIIAPEHMWSLTIHDTIYRRDKHGTITSTP